MSTTTWRSRLRPFLPTLRARYGVRQLWLFGPHTRRDAPPGAPLDILADIDGALSYDDFHALQTALAEIAGMPVELVLKGSMDPAIAEIVIPEMIAL